MKKIIIPILLVVLSVQSLCSQNERHEISIGYGAPTTHTHDFFMLVIFHELANQISSEKYNKYYSGSCNVTYKYNCSKKINVGGTFSYQPEKIGKQKNKHSEEIIYRRNYFSFAAELDVKYLTTSYVQLYSGCGIGILHRTGISNPDPKQKYDKNFTGLNLQLTTFGIKIGQKFGVFGELGFGYKGTSIGAFGRF